MASFVLAHNGIVAHAAWHLVFLALRTSLLCRVVSKNLALCADMGDCLAFVCLVFLNLCHGFFLFFGY